MYDNRPLSALFPDLERLGADHHARHHEQETSYTPIILDCLSQLVALESPPGRALVVGCGPKPRALMTLAERGFDAIGIEPVPDTVSTARAFCGGKARVVYGSAEELPVEPGSCRFVLMESVLEHVDSVPRCLNEVFRVLQPGGVLFIYTTNRYKLSLWGRTGEYSTPFVNWFPRIVRECYVHDHLHFRPQLASFTARPAVHWFTYDELCAAGRAVGFATFYSMLDLVPAASPWVKQSGVRRWMLGSVRRSPWLRALALTQAGGSIFMVKRPRAEAVGSD